MKKNKLILTVISLFAFMPFVKAAEPTIHVASTSKNLTQSQCIAFSDDARHIGADTNNKLYYTYCYHATCNDSRIYLINQESNSGYKCNNNNKNPYTKITSTGCPESYSVCSGNESYYCERVVFVDCNLNKDGSKYVASSTTTTTKKTTTTSTKKTTKKSTTKTTSKKTTQKVGTSVIIPNTTTTTKVTTSDPNDDNTNIAKLKINKEKVEIIEGETSYTVKIPYGVIDAQVDVTLETSKSTYEVIGNTNMPDEDCSMIIEVTSKSGNKKQYYINVIRYKELSKDCTLAKIDIDGYKLKNFKSSDYSYKLKVDKQLEQLGINPVVNDAENATYEIKNNDKLKNNKKVLIVVTAEDGSKCTYTIKIKKPTAALKIIIFLVILIAGGSVGGYYILRNIKKSKGKYKYE